MSATLVTPIADSEWTGAATAIGPKPEARLEPDAYNIGLIAAHAAVWGFYVQKQTLRAALITVEPLCWPFFESCWRFRLASHGQIDAVLLGYALLIGSAALAHLMGYRRLARVQLALLAIALSAIVALDYRLRANAIYMLLWVNVVYVCAAHRRWTMPVLIVAMYWSAGTLKLNREWLSGAGLYEPLWLIPAHLTPAACWYVLLLELTIVPMLLTSRPALRWIAFTQLALFHLESLSQIEWLYPAVMAALLSWFPIEWWREKADWQPTLKEVLRGKAPGATYAVVLAFGALQLAPWLYHGDRAITGQGKILALNMFESKQVCDVHAVLHRTDGAVENRDIKLNGSPPRMICDPIVYYDRVQNICRRRATMGVVNVDFFMSSRRGSDSAMTPVVAQIAFCTKGFQYRVLRNNDWISHNSSAQ